MFERLWNEIGPYDELLITPGLFSRPDSPTEYYAAITRIYVSTPSSVLNGRKNWNIPKHLAHFTFTPISSTRTLLTVSLPSPSSPSFFKAILKTKFGLPLPVRTSWLDTTLSRWLLQGRGFEFLQLPIPILPSSELDYELQNSSDTGGQGKSLKVKPRASSWMKIAKLEKADGEEGKNFGDGVDWPEFVVYTGVGAVIDFRGEVGLDFPVPEVVE
ncbi:hypothetical protein P7C70_g2148, partial [Phenoliferia sp. Uapishka_3]